MPACEHADRAGATCDYFSWRKRGWCRMEFGASKLARGDDMPLLVIESAATLYYFNPCDTVRLCAARGEFSVAEDVHAVNRIVGRMALAKADYYAAQAPHHSAAWHH